MSDSTAPNPSTALARVVADELARCGVTDAVMAPGSRSAALAIALHEAPGIRLHTEIDERSAGFCALGLARASGRPAAVIVTSGSAVANLLPAVVEADLARVPWLALTADRPPELRETGANQTIDQTKLFGGAVRWFVDPGVAEDRPGAVAHWRSVLARAVAEAAGVRGPAGPVHVNLSFREPTVPTGDDGRTRGATYRQPLDGREGRRPWTHAEPAVPGVPAERVAVVADWIRAVDRGLIVVGEGEDDAPAVADLARAAGWPIVAEPLASSRANGIGPGDPEAPVIAAAHWLAGHPGFAEAHRPQVVLRIGRTGLSQPLAELLDAGVPELLIDADGTWLDPRRSVAELVVAEAGPFVRAVARELGGAVREAARERWRTSWRDADRVARAAIDAVLGAGEAPSEPRAARDAAAAVPDGGTLVVGSSMPVRDLDMTMRPRSGLRVVGSRGASGIDGFVSTALGVALATEGATLALAGDLSLLHDVNGFLLSPDRVRLDCTFVVVANDGGGIFHLLPPAAHAPGFERLFGTPHGVEVGAVAALHGLPHSVVERPSELAGAIADSCDAGGIRLLELRTDRAAQARLRARLATAVGEALTAARG